MRTAFPATALCVALLAAFASPVRAESASAWARDGSTALRLVDGGPAVGASGARLAAIAIELDPGWKTYWRQPGASGVPPRFDFSGSINVKRAEVAFPAPERSVGDDGVTNVYHGRVIIPVTIEPVDPGQPVGLRLKADYGVCEQVCVPVRAETELELAPGADVGGEAAEDARRAAGATPRPEPLGGAGPLAVRSVTRSGSPVAVEIAVAAPAGDGEPQLFAETGDGDFAPSPELVGAPDAGRATFRMTFDEPELPASGLKLTLAAGGRAIETPVALDAIARKP